MTIPHCERGHLMTLSTHFIFDHDPDDSPRDTALLEQLRAHPLVAGSMGARVALYECRECNEATAIFSYPDGEER
jgi:hypothetical protein